MKLGGKEQFLVVGALGLVAYLAVLAYVPSVNDIFLRLGNSIERISVDYGYWGGFISSVLSNATIMIPVPNTAIILVVAAAGLNPWLLGFLAGIGAGLGELTSYVVGFFGYKLSREKFREQAKALRHLLENRPWFTNILLFLVGALPIPDDIFMIPLGVIRYNIFKAMLPFMVGKIVITTVIALFGAETNLFASGTNEHELLLHGTTLFGTLLIIYLILKTDWERLGKRLTRS